MGLLVLRLAAGFSLVGVEGLASGLGELASLVLRYAALVVAVPLLLGFGTPLVAIGQAVIQVGIMVLGRRYESSAVVATAVGVALAMLGPGAWSLDARVFGRKRLV
jgi:putative oxidoreductase